MSEKQFYLLQVNDALFPIGGYSHSQGLETYIQRGIVRDIDTAREYILHKIKWNLAYTELLSARLAYEAAEGKDLQKLLHLEEILEALNEAMTHYLYAQTSAIVTNCVKTIPLSQTSGQQLLSGCYVEFDDILTDVMNRREDDLCLSAPGFDLRGIQHEKLYSRLYMS